MFRPGDADAGPARAALPLLLSMAGLVGLVVAGALAAGIQYQRYAQQAGVLPVAGPGGAVPASLVGAALGLLVGAGAALGALAAYRHYRSAMQTLERVRGFMRNVLDSIPTGVLTVDGQSVVTSLNSSGERLLGLRRSAIRGRRVVEALQTAPELARCVSGALARDRLLEEQEVALERADGRRLAVRVAVSELRGVSGETEGLVVLLRDVTEVTRLEAQLRRSDKLAALGTLAAGIAHEIRNPLHALGLNLHLLQAELAGVLSQGATVAGHLDVLRFELQRLERIVENFLHFSRPAMPEMKPVRLQALLERVVGLVAFEAAGHGVAIETRCDPTLDTILGDDGQLCQVLLNVLINALQAMPDGGGLFLTTRRDGDTAEIAVRDTGRGIPEDALPHVFDPYFTTRPGGVGLGLSIAHRIVQAHHGTMDMESRPGSGTTLLIRLPVCQSAGSTGVA